MKLARTVRTAVLVAASALALLACTACANRGQNTTDWGRPVQGGLRAPAEVSPCCADLAAGKITLAQCMENPECRRNNRACCMNAIRAMERNAAR